MNCNHRHISFDFGKITCAKCGAVATWAKPPETDTSAPHKFQDQADEALDAIATRKDAEGAAVSPDHSEDVLDMVKTEQEPCKTCEGLGFKEDDKALVISCPDCNGTGKKP